MQSFESDQIAELYIALCVWVGGEGLWSNPLHSVHSLVWAAAYYQLTSPVALISPTPFLFRNRRQYNIKQLEWGGGGDVRLWDYMSKLNAHY